MTTLDLFWGEFLTSPVPLELSLNDCSHSCTYCFAAHGRIKERRADTGQIMSLLANYQDRVSPAAMLLREGYPVVMSNRSDPFAHNNSEQALQIIRVMAESGIGVALQTKGGRGTDEAIAMLPPSCWYISISFWDEAKRKVIEPGAPSIAQRLQLIEALRAKGHEVVVGLNPLVPEWLPTDDAEKLIARLKSLGVHGCWIELLHFNKSQVAAMSQKEKDAIGATIIKRGMSPRDDLEKETFCAVRSLVQDAELEVYSMNQGIASDIWRPYRALYAKTFPTNQDFVNWSHDTIIDGGVVVFDDLWKVVEPHLPKGQHRIRQYMEVGARALNMEYKIPTRMTYKQLLKLYWKESRIWGCPARVDCFSYALEGDAQLTEEDGMPYMAFSHDVLTEMYTEVDVKMLMGGGD